MSKQGGRDGKGRGGRGDKGRGRGRNNNKKTEELVKQPIVDATTVENSDSSILLIDGSYGEGGGQVLRNSVALAAILGRNVRVINIRANRKKPGLAHQHLTGIQLVNDMARGLLNGGKVGSTDITFKCGGLKGGNYEADVKTAGSTSLLMQISVPCMLYSPIPVEVVYKGGTNAIMAPQIDYLIKVFQPMAKRFGIEMDIEVVKRGFFPKGGGVVSVKIQPHRSINPLQLETKGVIKKVEIFSFCSGVISEEVSARMAKEAEKTIKPKLDKSVELKIIAIKEAKDKAIGEGTGILITAYTDTGCIIAGSALGERGKRAEDVGIEAAGEFLRNLKHGGCVDEYLQDQIIIFMGLADGDSKVKVGPLTEHTRTSIHFTQLITGAIFTVSEAPRETEEEETYWIECKGIGFKNSHLDYLDDSNEH